MKSLWRARCGLQPRTGVVQRCAGMRLAQAHLGAGQRGDIARPAVAWTARRGFTTVELTKREKSQLKE
jgi:hypothetical protein